jgi:hypothetical protein
VFFGEADCGVSVIALLSFARLAGGIVFPETWVERSPSLPFSSQQLFLVYLVVIFLVLIVVVRFGGLADLTDELNLTREASGG